MPDDSIDKRLRNVENKVYSFEQSFDRIADDIHEIKTSILEFIEVKSKLGAIDILFKRVDELRNGINNLDKTMTPVINDHLQCLKKREPMESQVNKLENRVGILENDVRAHNKINEGAVSFLSGRMGNLVDWLFKIGIIVIAVYAAKHGV